MSKTMEMETLLQKLIHVLKEEKEVLIKNDAEKLMDLVDKKKDLLTAIQGFKIEELTVTDELKTLAHEMDTLQETNLLLTRQGLSFQDMILKALAKNNTSKYSTYSSKGSYEAQEEVKIVDQSV